MKKLLEAKRGNVIEREHYGYLLSTNSEDVLYKNFDEGRLFYLRSCAKPLQASVLQDLGVFEKFDFNSQEIAVVSSSHSGTQAHIDIVKGILDKVGLDESYLKCGIHAPLDKNSRHYMLKNNIEPSAIHNNCSGKHSGFLSACVLKGWDLENYLDFEHPLQKMIKTLIRDYCNFDGELSKDGCNAPIMAMPMVNMSYGFAKCFNNYPKIKEAMADNPDLMGGAGRIDTEIIRATKGDLIAKVGAEGLCMVYNTQNQQVFSVKILDSNMQARSIVLVEALKQLGWIGDEQIDNNPLHKLCSKVVKSLDGSIVGEMVTTFGIF